MVLGSKPLESMDSDPNPNRTELLGALLAPSWVLCTWGFCWAICLAQSVLSLAVMLSVRSILATRGEFSVIIALGDVFPTCVGSGMCTSSALWAVDGDMVSFPTLFFPFPLVGFSPLLLLVSSSSTGVLLSRMEV